MSEQNEWFDQLYREHSARLTKTAFHVLLDRQLAEDMVDETFLTLLYAQRELIQHPNIGGWLTVTLKNILKDELKSARRKHEAPFVFNKNTTEHDTYNHSLKDLLPKELSLKEQEILILLFEEQLSYDEIAKRLGISITNCRTRAFRAKVHCRELMKTEEK